MMNSTYPRHTGYEPQQFPQTVYPNANANANPMGKPKQKGLFAKVGTWMNRNIGYKNYTFLDFCFGIAEPAKSLIICLLVTFDNNFLNHLIFNFKTAHHDSLAFSQSYGSGLLLLAITQYFFWNNITDIAVKRRWLMFVIFADAHRLYTYGKHIFIADEEIGFSNLLYHSIYVSFFLLHLFGIVYYNNRAKIYGNGHKYGV
jgi:hypothetical protein